MFHDGIHQADLETHKETPVFCFLPVIQIKLNGIMQTCLINSPYEVKYKSNEYHNNLKYQ